MPVIFISEGRDPYKLVSAHISPGNIMMDLDREREREEKQGILVMGVESEALREITSENSLGEESSQMLKEIDEGKILVQVSLVAREHTQKIERMKPKEKRKKKEEAEGLHEREEKESKKEDAKRERSKKRNLNVQRARWPMTRTWKKRKRSAKKMIEVDRRQRQGWPGMIEDDCERRIGEDECEQAVGSESQEDDGQHQWQSGRCSKTVHEALSHFGWRNAIIEEINAIDDNAKGYAQTYGVDYFDTFSPVAKEEVYMEQPPWFVAQKETDKHVAFANPCIV
ncbi:Cysteine-rich RLK (RECEPTOR-like protein kinase) 8 [Cucumis melo var. makuwa]|uniref:Cysteine-rich RLK (RECEPTOR-like protein kinase) 8 n=1 Tax=Cucumis melo var. makuwa TaxID=1194695 RepID=A0A5A7UH45_CUCMM|nr:Cysteine-rich RLK (RECEPTOR-like protein kinase) 8 [Cucumis melo var. makuwa]